MDIPKRLKIKNTVKHPTTLIVNGANRLGVELAESLTDQGGYVVILDKLNEETLNNLMVFPEKSMISFVDISEVINLEDSLRRLDYVFYLAHDDFIKENKISTGQFLIFSNYLDSVLSLSQKFNCKFLLSTSAKRINEAYTISHEKIFYNNPKTGNTYSYTNAELQKYAEGLVFDYENRFSLNVRIIRVGDIIGEGIDLAIDTPFNKLLRYAVHNEQLLLDSDGLSQEWLVHLSDCAYGLLKGMFSKESKSNTYTLSYESSFTHLSLAYKIQEIDENIREIKFIGTETFTLPSVTAYKPAKNISAIGWSPKVTLEKAVLQSLSSARLYYLESVNNLRGNILTTGLSEEGGFWSQWGGGKSEDMHRVNNLLKNSRKGIKGTLGLLEDTFWSYYIKLVKIFKPLEAMTPLSFVLLMVFMPVFAIVFIYIISPILYTAGNSVIYYNSLEVSKSSIEDFEIDKFVLNNTKSWESISNIQSTFDQNKYIYEKILPESSLDEISKTIRALKTKTYEHYTYANILRLSDEIVSKFKPDVVYIPNTGNMLSIKGFSSSLKPELDKIKRYKPQVIYTLEQTSKIPFSSNYAPLVTTINSLEDISNSVKKLSYPLIFPEILGNNRPHSIAVILLDNTRLTPIGGDIAGVLYITFDNGVITNLKLVPSESIKFVSELVSEEIITFTNQRRFLPLDKSAYGIKDFTSIGEYLDFSDSIKPQLENDFGFNIDSIMTMDLITLGGLIAQGSEDISLLGVNFQEQTLLNNLNSLQTVNPNIQEKHQLITQLGGVVFTKYLNNLNTNFERLVNILGNSLKNGNSHFNSNITSLSSLIYNNNTNEFLVYKKDFFINVSVTNTNLSLVNIPRFTSIPISYDVVINENFSTKQSIKFDVPEFGSSQELSVCMPLKVLVTTIKSNIPIERRRVIQSESKVCLIMNHLPGDSSNITVDFETLPFFSTVDSNSVLKLAIAKPNGIINSNLIFSMTNNSNSEISLNSDNLKLVGESGVFSIPFVNDLFIDVGFKGI